MKLFIAVIYSTIAFLALATVATAAGNNPSLCAKDGWNTAQSSSGQPFASMKDCAKAREVFAPTLTITPSHVGAGERFDLTATGFHPNATSVIYFSVGPNPYFTYTPIDPLDTSGSIWIPMQFSACGNSLAFITITLVDSYGVHASAGLTLC